jgi:hypothetical protein
MPVSRLALSDTDESKKVTDEWKTGQGGKLTNLTHFICKDKPCDFQIKMIGGGNLCSSDPKVNKAACKDEKVCSLYLILHKPLSIVNTTQKEIEQLKDQPAATPSDTSDDGSSDSDAKRSMAVEVIVRRYLTSTGREIELDGENNIGRSIFKIVARNETLHEEQIYGHVFDPDDEEDEFAYMQDNLEVREETVVSVV